jgi:hypothetical protein
MDNKLNKYVFGAQLNKLRKSLSGVNPTAIAGKNISIALYCRRILALMLLAVAPATVALWQQTQAYETSAYECTQVSLDKVDQALLTREERIALLDNTLTSSIDSYSSCVSSVAQNMSGGGSGQGSDLDSAQSGASNQPNGDQATGNRLSLTPEKAIAGLEGGEQVQNKESAIPPNINQVPNTPSSNGATSAPRGIIAPKDNDKIICKLLFQEITKVQDADMLKGLEQQYRNYQCG